MARRFYVNKPLNVNDVITFTGEDYNHIINVLRYKLNDKLIICNGSEFDFLCCLEKIDKKLCEFKVLSKQINQVETKTNVSVFQALVKGEKFELIAQKLTELGVNTLIPFVSKFVVVKQNTTRLDRLEKISIEAIKQCGRAKPLKIENIISFNEMLNKLSEYDIVVFANENSNNNFDFANLKKYNGKNVAVIIGSEGGFDKDEVDQLSNLQNVKEITLGKRILRAETACICLTAVVMNALNEWNI